MKKIDKIKLAKLLGVLGSQHDGEILSAVRMVVKMLKEADTTWYQVLGVEKLDDEEPEGPPVRTRQHRDDVICQKVKELLEFGYGFTEWEKNFLHSLKLLTRYSPKQIEMIEAIYEQKGRRHARRRA